MPVIILRANCCPKPFVPIVVQHSFSNLSNNNLDPIDRTPGLASNSNANDENSSNATPNLPQQSLNNNNKTPSTILSPQLGRNNVNNVNNNMNNNINNNMNNNIGRRTRRSLTVPQQNNFGKNYNNSQENNYNNNRANSNPHLMGGGTYAILLVLNEF